MRKVVPMAADVKPIKIRSLASPRWIITTLLVLAAVGVMVRLGFWQLDRLAQRRAFNAAVEAQINAAPLDLNQAMAGKISPGDLLNMEYRKVTVAGEYDPANQVILRNQVNNNQPGYHLITPFKIQGTAQSVLVDRGFIPFTDKTPADWTQYARPGPLTLSGQIRLGHVPQIFGVADPTLAPGQTRLDAWNYLNVPRIQSQTPYALLPVYVQLAPETAATAADAPIASLDQPDLTEGPHMSYAIQWFTFAAILALGYPYFVRRQLQEKNPPAAGDRNAG